MIHSFAYRGLKIICAALFIPFALSQLKSKAKILQHEREIQRQHHDVLFSFAQELQPSFIHTKSWNK